MGAWGHGPLETDDAADVIGAVRYVLDAGWEPLREDEVDDDGLALATEAAAITLSLVRAGIRVQPEDGEELFDAWSDMPLPEAIAVALNAEPAAQRPGFPDERGVERWLREGRAPYDVWMSAAAYGDDRAAAWLACTDAAALFTMARLAGVPDGELARALAACALSLVADDAADAVVLRGVLGRLAAGEALDNITQQRLSNITTQGGDLHTAIVTTSFDLARGGIRHGLGRLRRLVDAVPDLGMRVHQQLDPLVRGRL
jgi:hypothetical protein